MKKLIKKAFKSILIIILIFSGLILIGVILPKEVYTQKQEVSKDLLITNCSIIDVKSGKTITNRQILIQNNKIKTIDSLIIDIPKNIKTINANGQYLMPSLWDMHIHTLSLSPQLHFPLLIASGVTNVRDMGDGDSWISDVDDNSERDKSKWEQLLLNENLLLPKIHQATSFHVEELDEINKDNYKQKVSELIGKLKNRGEPFVKVQLESAEIPDFIFYELQLEAKKQGIPILGHLSPNLNVNQVLDNGFTSIEHAWALIPHFTKNKKKFKSDITQKQYDLTNQDTTIANDILQRMANKKTYYTPTHITSNRKEYLAFDPKFNENPNNVYIENVQLFFWKTLNWFHTKGYDKETDLPVLKRYYEQGLQITNWAHKNGVKILAGTDALDRNVYHGISLHEELQEMVKAGLSNAEALRTATLYPAEYYQITKDYGSIEVGKIAEFVLLEKNPLENIENTKTISTVYYNGRLYNSEDLEQMKSFVKKQAKSFGITCKFIWNMIKKN